MDWLLISKLTGGLGLFLYGMHQLEDALRELGGRAFKLFLRRHTSRPLKALLSGTIITALLQSSSVVTFIVLGFVGAGVFSMESALAVVLGSNLGTTLSNWLVAFLGFKLDIESYALPVAGLAGIGLVFSSGNRKLFHSCRFLLGFALLFLGLDYIRDAIEAGMKDFDFGTYLDLPVPVFILIGFVITALIQSSSATMVITLSALHSGVLPFHLAVAVIIGSESGTAVKSLLAALGGAASKRKVATGNLLFNLFITLFAYALMRPLISLRRTFS